MSADDKPEKSGWHESFEAGLLDQELRSSFVARGTLSDFLLARIAEDEAEAKAVQAYAHGSLTPYLGDGTDWLDAYVARWDPARVLAECEAKRRIVELHELTASYDYVPALQTKMWFVECAICGQCDGDREGGGCPTLFLLALPYADHPDYREEWKP